MMTTPNFISEKFRSSLYIIHINKEILKMRIGEMINKDLLVEIRVKDLFLNNFRASEKDWRIPLVLILLGPSRNWISLRSFRSKSTRKETLIKIPIMFIMKITIILGYKS